MSMEAKIAALRTRMKTASGKRGVTVKLGDTGFMGTIEGLPAERTVDGLIALARSVGLREQYKKDDVNGATVTEKAHFLPGAEAEAAMADMLRDEKEFTEPTTGPTPDKRGRGRNAGA